MTKKEPFYNGLRCFVVSKVINSRDFILQNADKLKMNKSDIEVIVACIKSHMGPWNTNDYSNVILPVPKSKMERFVHMCDYLASRKTMDFEFND